MWDLGSSSLLKELRGHEDAVYSLSFSRDGSLLASGGAEPLVRLWDVRRPTALSGAASSRYNLPLVPEGSLTGNHICANQVTEE